MLRGIIQVENLECLRQERVVDRGNNENQSMEPRDQGRVNCKYLALAEGLEVIWERWVVTKY